MASASKRTVEKTRMVEEKYTEFDGVVLELSDAEAATLRAVVGAICGNPDGLREHTDEIYNALGRVGFTNNRTDVRTAISKLSGYPTFS